ncbi:ATPase domain-containing protein [uncultured Jannaschia sp.]|uniref:ATPase domain-containing protein n=1 Tax=uncultured Jannaschia sp. TaxID=293347 RepID=UPI002615A442|nr:ATPase domain-containing protein [uncultured Jannaschia sp.]
MADTSPEDSEKAPTGIGGLDDILGGGLPRGEMHLVRGGAGTGKTTLGLQFLRDGVARGETVLFVTLSQTERALRKIAASHGWSLDGVRISEQRGAGGPDGAEEQTIFHTAVVELGETMSALTAEIDRADPDRIVIDAISTIRHLADTPLRYHRQLLVLRDFLAPRRATVLITDSGQTSDTALDELVHGTLVVDRNAHDYGDVRRSVHLAKMRGVSFHGGSHNFRIRTGGLDVFPRLEPQADASDGTDAVVESGARELDALLGGGLEAGTACMVVGATGTGKTSVATLYAYAAAGRGDRAAIFTFDERRETFLKRSEGLGMDLRPLVEAGLIRLQAVRTAELAPTEFTDLVRRAVEEDGAKVVMIDSLTGYFHSMPQENALITQMHDLLYFLGQTGVLSLLIVNQHGMVGERVRGPMEVSYLADTVILLRHFEASGSVRKAISVLKKRYGPHETTIRELQLAPGRVEVGDPITDFTGVLSGRPEFLGHATDLPE